MLPSAAQLRVRFDETDQMQIVHHGVYFNYFEVGRVEFFRSIGYDIRTMEQSGLRLVVVRVDAAYRRSARFDELLDIGVDVIDVGSASLTFGYEIRREGELLVTGSTRLACVKINGRPSRFPADFRQALERAATSDRGLRT